MDVTIFFARFYGGLYLVLGVLSLTRASLLRKTIDRTSEPLFTTATGYVSLTLGLATVVLHQVWVLDWPVLVTLVGWATLGKGIAKTGFPDLIHRQAEAVRGKATLSAIAIMLLGIVLLALSFLDGVA